MIICYEGVLHRRQGKRLTVANATTISSGQPVLCVAIDQLATYTIYLARCLRCQNRSEHIKFNYVESPYSLKISFRMILCLSSLQLDVKSENLQMIWQEVTVTKNSGGSSNYALKVKFSRWNSQIAIKSISIKISKYEI